MLSTRVSSTFCNPKPLAQLSRAAAPIYHATSLMSSTPVGLRLAVHPSARQQSGAPRTFSTTSAARMKDFFPAKETEHIRQTPAAWPHAGYTEKEMLEIVPGHRQPETLGDKFAWNLMKLCKWGMDTANGLSKESAKKPLTESQWFIRIIFLESIAGVPGMVAGMLRHLHSLRRLKRDNGWIETLLEESYNERMHLLTFMKMCEPGWFMKFLILGAQGVFFNAFFVSYLISPKICHRFVGYLEEEAVGTYTRCLREMDAGCVPKWTDPKFEIPDIAVKYWNMPEGHRTMRDLILYVRADEANHRGTNHTLANLDPKEDPNPFVSEYKSGNPAPKAALKPAGYERSDVI